MTKKKTNLPKTYRIAVYTRVSTEEQAENPEGSIKTQELRLREYVKLKNFSESFGEIIAVFSDPGVSAKDMNRPGFQKMLASIERGEIDMVLVTELSRFSRSTRDFTQLQEFLEEHDCKFLSLRENFDTSGAAGSMVLNMMASIAEFERRQTGERVAHSFLSRAKRGLYNGGSVPLGYKVDESKPGYLFIDEESAEIVRLAFKSFIKYETLSATAKYLNTLKLDIPKRMQGGGGIRSDGFTIDNLFRLLKNKAYIGVRTYQTKSGEEECPAVWEAIIDRELFERVGRRLKKNRHKKRTFHGNKFTYTLSGLTACKCCGDRLCGKTSTSADGSRVGYYEHNKINRLQTSRLEKIPKHNPHRIPARKVEPVVWVEVKKFILSDKFAEDLLARARVMQDSHNQQDDLQRQKVKIRNLSRQIEALAERIGKLPSDFDASPLLNELKRLQVVKTEADCLLVDKERNKPLSDEPVSLESLQVFRRGLKALVEKGDDNKELQAMVIKKVINQIAVLPDGIEIHFHTGSNHYLRELGKTPSSQPLKGFGGYHQGYQKNLKVGCASRLTIGEPGTTRTYDLLLRRQLLYPAELRVHW